MFLSETQLYRMGFKSIGDNVLISDKVSLYNTRHISIGDNVRIDDFSILSAGEDGIGLGNNVHIACYCSLIGKAKISIGNYTGVSAKCSIYSSSDDYSGEWLSNPTVPDEFKNVFHSPVILEDNILVGCGSVILPGVTIGIGSSVAALSLVNRNIPEFCLYGGVPAKFIREQSHDLLLQRRKYEECI